MSFLNHLINGISLGSIYAIIALGYTMVYGIAKMLNFAHGDVIMVGAYMCFCATTYLGWPSIAGVALAVVVCTVLGVVIERLAYKPLRMAPSLAVLITAIGVSYFLQNAALLIWGSSTKSFTSVVGGQPIQLFGGQLSIAPVTIVTVLTCIVIMVVLTLFTNKSKAGTAMRVPPAGRQGTRFLQPDSRAAATVSGSRNSRSMSRTGPVRPRSMTQTRGQRR